MTRRLVVTIGVAGGDGVDFGGSLRIRSNSDGLDGVIVATFALVGLGRSDRHRRRRRSSSSGSRLSRRISSIARSGRLLNSGRAVGADAQRRRLDQGLDLRRDGGLGDVLVVDGGEVDGLGLAAARGAQVDLGAARVDLGDVLGVVDDARPVPHPHDGVLARGGQVGRQLEVGLAGDLGLAVLGGPLGVDGEAGRAAAVLVADAVVVVVGGEEPALAVAALAVRRPRVQHVVDAVAVLVLLRPVHVDVAAAERPQRLRRVRHVPVLLVLQGHVVARRRREPLVRLVRPRQRLAHRRVRRRVQDLVLHRDVVKAGRRAVHVPDRVPRLALVGAVRADQADGLDPRVRAGCLQAREQADGGGGDVLGMHLG